MKEVAMALCCIRFPNCFCRTGNREMSTGARRDSVVATGRNPSLTGIQILPSSLDPAKSDEDLDEDYEGPRNIFCCANLLQNRGLFFLGSLGALFMAVASAIYLLNPLEIIAKSQLTLRDGSFSYDTWRKPPIKVGVKIFIFNYTNSEAFLRGEEKLKVEEVGPYVYAETLENNNVTFNDNNTVTYSPQRTVAAIKELTVGNPKTDWVIVPNVVFLGVASYLADHSLLTNMAFNTFASVLDSQAFLNITVEEYLWGYEDPLIHYASKLIPETIHFNKFGYLDRMFDDGPNVVSMNLNAQAEMRDGKEIRPLSIELYNGSPGLKHWGYDPRDNTTHKKCNTLQGYATEGILFPRNMSPKDDFVIYRKAFCRTLQIVFDHEGENEGGIPAYHYKLRDDSFDNTNPDNSCYCDKKDGPCLKKGLSNISPCYYNIPVAVSFPHFYNADPSLLEDIDGLNPNAKDHGSFAVIQPDMGVIMRAHSRIQSNLIMKNTKYNGKAAPFNNMVIPIFWTDFYFDDLPPNLNSILNLLIIIAPILQTVVMVAFMVAGIVMTVITLLNTFSKQKPGKLTEMWTTPSGYENVQIIPIIRRESLGAA